MSTLLQPLVVLLLYVTVDAGDTAIRSAYANAVIRAIAFGIVALLALIAVILMLVR